MTWLVVVLCLAGSVCVLYSQSEELYLKCLQVVIYHLMCDTKIHNLTLDQVVQYVVLNKLHVCVV